MYLTLRNSDDGLIWHTYNTAEALQEMIKEETSDDLVPEARIRFVGLPPTAYSNTNEVFIMKGEHVIPTAVKVVTEWMV